MASYAARSHGCRGSITRSGFSLPSAVNGVRPACRCALIVLIRFWQVGQVQPFTYLWQTLVVTAASLTFRYRASRWLDGEDLGRR